MRKGFTLIELLAVIVILAIIALIAVPIVLSIINDSKKSSEKESLNLYTDTVEKMITKKQMNNPNFKPDKCTIKEYGNLECFNGETSLGEVEISMKGDMPTSGTVIIDGNNIKYENIVLNGKTYYEKVAPSFEIGDKITYQDEEWYVIGDSSSSQDYVTVIKNEVLTVTELGIYAYEKTCNSFEASHNIGGCSADGQIIKYEYTKFDDNSNVYAESNIKAALEAYIVDKGISNDLKEIDGYKIRLITINELKNNLGWNSVSTTENSHVTDEGNNVPLWVYNNQYWTMTPKAGDNFDIWYVDSGGTLYTMNNTSTSKVRPVINLLKSAIPNE